MSPQRPGSMDRRLELACDRALVGLSPGEEAELVSLMAAGERLDPGLELAAAAVALAEMSIEEPLPQHMAERVMASALQAVPAPLQVVRGGTLPMVQQAPRALPRAPAVAPLRPPQPAAPTSPSRRFFPGRAAPWLAAAACLVLAIGSFLYRGRPSAELATGLRMSPGISGSSSSPFPQPTPAGERARLLAEAPDVTRAAWAPATDPSGQAASGDVVWSTERQRGFMTFRALAANDPLKSQYQLWIFDGERDERYPVDGGVFDIDASTGEVVIPISAKVRVAKPTLFVVTVERPGGVVVSTRERVVAAAKVPS